jgi:CBS domain-containing membrane protein
MHPTSVRDIMTPVVEVLQMGDTVDLAARHMKLGRIRHLPIVDGDQNLIGLITHRKLVSAWLGHGDPGHEKPHQIDREIPVEMIMETDVVTTWPGAPISEVAAIMETRKIGCVVVLNEGKVVGIITEADFVKLARRMFERLEAR